MFQTIFRKKLGNCIKKNRFQEILTQPRCPTPTHTNTTHANSFNLQQLGYENPLGS